MIRNVVVFTSVAMCCGSLALADSNSKSLRPLLEASTPVAFNRPSTAVDLYIDQTKVAFRSTEVAGDFLNLAMEQFASLRAPDKKAAGDAYYIIHLLRWKDPQQAADPSNPAAETGFSLNVDAQNWYVYHRGTWSTEDFSSRNRLYGAKTIYLLYVELNVPASASIRPIYTLNYVEKTADNVNHLLSLLSLFLPSSATGGASKLAEAPPRILWGAGNFENIKAPSDVTVSVAFEPAPTRQDASLAGAPGERAAAAELPIPDAEHDDVWWLQFRRRYPTTTGRFGPAKPLASAPCLRVRRAATISTRTRFRAPPWRPLVRSGTGMGDRKSVV